jgi:hypothetical protein
MMLPAALFEGLPPGVFDAMATVYTINTANPSSNRIAFGPVGTTPARTSSLVSGDGSQTFVREAGATHKITLQGSFPGIVPAMEVYLGSGALATLASNWGGEYFRVLAPGVVAGAITVLRVQKMPV